jgi:hypothetical protein
MHGGNSAQMGDVALPQMGKALRAAHGRPIRAVLMGSTLVILIGMGVVAIRTAIVRRRDPDRPTDD